MAGDYARPQEKKKNEMNIFSSSTLITPAGWLTEKTSKVSQPLPRLCVGSGAGVTLCERVLGKKGWEIKMSSNKGRETLTGFAVATNRISV
ncbi:hypothetical protein BPOR_0957g00030 [Botrytis porri]|uniref:Uncharacterized protein n=1 Tax=Botrytis porri TaxID=87229 RepID=A0A4Z1KEN1_9HELO|nr:hypothetical protein BPOR_0957g00030 [Botrytis porri]